LARGFARLRFSRLLKDRTVKRFQITKQKARNFEPLWSFLVVLVAVTLAAFSNFVVQFVLARTLGPAQFGAFSSALAIVMLVAPIAAFGIGSWWLRIFGEEGYAANRWVKPSLQFSVLSAFSVFALLMGWTIVGPHDRTMGVLIATLTSVVFAQVTIDLLNARFQLEGRYISLAAWQLISHPLRLAGLVLLALYVPLLTAFHVAYLYSGISLLVFFVGCSLLASFYKGKIRLAGNLNSADLLKIKGSTDKPSLKSVLLGTFPFGVESFLFLVYYQTDLVLLYYIANEEAVGFYGASVIFMAAVYLLPSIIYQKFLLPKIHRWAYEESNRLHVFIRTGGVLLFLGGLLMTLIIWNGASYFVPILLGQDYVSSVPLLTLMCLAIPFRYLSVHLGSILATRDFIWINVKITAVTALLNVILNLMLIPQYGASGAAFATLLSHVSLAVLFFIATQSKLKVYGSGK